MIKVGIIGCGKITELRHAPEYNDNPDVEQIYFYDRHPERAQRMADIYNGKVFDSVEDLLASDIDGVSICVANVDHARYTIQALRAGKHVLCEKPMAVTLAESEAMADTAEACGRYLMVGQNQRFARAHVEARRLLEQGEIGQPLAFRTTFGHPGPEGWSERPDTWFFDRDKAHLGSIGDLGAHKIDLMHYLLDEPIVSVQCLLQTVDKTYPDGTSIDVDDNAYCIFTTRSGIGGQMHTSWTFYAGEDNSTVIYGTDGLLRCYADPDRALIVERANGEKVSYLLDQMTTNEEQTSGGRHNTGVIDAFVKSIVTDTPPESSGKEQLSTMRVLAAAEESARTGCRVEIDQTGH